LTRRPDFLAETDVHEAAAAAWFARGQPDWSADDEAALNAWLAADPDHREAYDGLAATMALLDDHRDTPEVKTARRQALHASRPARRAVLTGGLVAAAAAVAAGVTVYPRLAAPSPVVYETAPAERRVVTLADGSRLALDAQTTVEARLGPASRDLWLKDGQVRIDVAHDKARPLSVRLGRQVVVATGTAFNLDQSAGRSTVTLVEGSVDIRAMEGGALLARLTPGQQYVADALRRHVAEADPAAVLAWSAGKLIFDDEPLEQAAARVGRYGQRRIRVARDVAGLRISGAFDAGDEAAFVRAVEAYLPVTVVYPAPGEVEFRPRVDR
jgi:transmembrane sensor